MIQIVTGCPNLGLAFILLLTYCVLLTSSNVD